MVFFFFFFFFKQKTAYDMRISDWSSDVCSSDLHLERFAVVAFAVARLARHIDVGQEVHLDLDQPVAGAGLAPPALDVEAEPPGLVPARLAFGQPREPVADDRDGACVSGGSAARGAAERRLVDRSDGGRWGTGLAVVWDLGGA